MKHTNGLNKLFLVFGAVLFALVCSRPISAQATNTFANTGNAGAGTTNPQGKLVVSSTNGPGANTGDLILENPTAYANGNTRTSAISFKTNNPDSLLGYESASIRALMTPSTGITSPQALLQFWTANNTQGLLERMRITEDGNVGIGTTSPNQKLTIKGDLALMDGANRGFARIGIGDGMAADTDSRFLFRNGTDTHAALRLISNNSSFFTIDSIQANNTGSVRNLVINPNGGNVGIGTAAPSYKLDVAGSGISLIGGGDVGAAVNITNTGKTGTGTANYWNLYNMTGSYGNKLSFWAYAANNACNGGLCQDTFDIYDNGVVHVPFKLGIGTNNPGSYTLKVSGNTNVTGNLTITANGTGTGNIVADGTINAKYQDVAEWVPSSEQLSAGTVVVLDSTKSNQVTSSSVSYDTRVAGVVSEQPGIALGEKSEGKVLVATTGRVRVRVDATKTPIHIGDLLVTSDVPGVAMKSEPVNLGGVQIHRPGTLIGKALEPLEKGKGEILVLLSLQ
jgi:hypothetical protein